MFCLSLEPSHLQLIKKLGYIPVGLGKKNFSKEWLRDNTEKNIASKNQFYGEYYQVGDFRVSIDDDIKYKSYKGRDFGEDLNCIAEIKANLIKVTINL